MATPASQRRLESIRALVIDGNPASLEMLSQVLGGFRLQRLKPCASSREARALLASDLFDLIVIEFVLPDEDAISLARHIRSDPTLPNHATPIIILHDHTPMDMVVRARDAGVNTIVRKPITPAVLLGQIEWIARSDRQFITVDTYVGPDRRFRRLPLPSGVTERRAEALALVSDPERALSQHEVNSLFG